MESEFERESGSVTGLVSADHREKKVRVWGKRPTPALDSEMN
jgi:hypothetical protein